MIRDLPRLAEREFDVLVVGGGIYGLTIAYDAAQRGLSVALVERGDFGAATSFNHLKTIHGGLALPAVGRYPPHARVDSRAARVRAHRAALGRAAGVRDADRRVADAQSDCDESGARDRRARRPRSQRRRRCRTSPSGGRVVAGAECRELFEGAIPTVASAAVWHDYQTINGDRLTLSFAKAAAAHGAVLANYTEAIGRSEVGGESPVCARATS